ncbi:MAG TPA: carbohydrate kinase [Actinomycetales bacterium]|nr:carbohydrate kinase [Actinomycetales bacterium]
MTVLVAGESLVDVVARHGGVVDRHAGGSPANVAVGLARLGHDVTLATRVGSDADGDLLRRHLEADGVRLSPGSVVDGRTSTATAVLDDDGAATYEFDVDWALPTVDLADVLHLHAGSIGSALPPGAADVHRLLVRAAEAGITTSYDPNLRPGLIGSAADERPVVERLVAGADVVKASDDDLAWLYAGTAAPDPVAAAARWARSGPQLVVLTRGADGAVAWVREQPDRPLHLPSPSVQVVDTVGAGDAFMSGLLSGLLDAGLLGARAACLDPGGPFGWTTDAVRPALLRALEVGALTCARPGADPPRRAELTARSAASPRREPR